MQDVGLAGADRDADPYFAGALHHGHQHDVHHPDPADDEGDHRDGGDQQRQGGRGLLHRLDDAVAAEGEEILHPVALGQQRHGGLLGQRGLDPVLDPYGDLAEVILGDEAAHHGAVRQPDIDRLAAGAKAGLLGHHPDDAHRQGADQHHLADGIRLAEQAGYGLAIHHGHRRPAADVPLIEQAALGEGHPLDPEKVAADPHHAATAGLVAIAQLARGGDLGAGPLQIGLAEQGVEIPLVQGLDAGGLLVTPILAGEDVDGIGAHGVDVVDHLGAGPLAQRHHADHGGDADDDAEHGEEGAHAVGQHGVQGHATRLPVAIPALAAAPGD